MTNETKKPVNRSIFHWNLTPDELEKQVKEYKTLGFFDTRRGIAASVAAAIIAFSTIAAFAGWTQYSTGEDALWSLIILAPIIVFIGRGHRWAILLFALFWTAEKFLQMYIPISNGSENISYIPLLWWFIIIPFFYQAFIVENARRKQK